MIVVIAGSPHDDSKKCVEITLKISAQLKVINQFFKNVSCSMVWTL